MSGGPRHDEPQYDINPLSPDGFFVRLKRRLIGAPRDLSDRKLFHQLSLIAFLAWIGLGADGLSSSCYGPEEAFKTLGEHRYLAIALALMMATTVCVIAIAYSRVIEHFPHGGGGYVVATKVLGKRAGVVSGSALLVDYMLTITISIAAAGDALFSFLPMGWHVAKLPTEAVLIAILIMLNFRGVRESVLVLTPIFLLFVVTHVVLIAGGVAAHAPELPQTLKSAADGFSEGLSGIGLGSMLLVLVHAYSLGGGTYTGIEAVSNGLAIMREPRVQTGKRTMFYMAASLAFTASGLLLCYLLWQVTPEPGKTMNAVLAEKFVAQVPLGAAFVILTMASEGALLVVAAQAGFVDGPRVLGNMAVDSWMPRRFAALSDRLTTQNGILLMGITSLAALLYTHGDVRQIVVMYAINVFITFSMTEFSMCRFFLGSRRDSPLWKREIVIHVVGLSMCLTILIVTVYEKFLEGGWITLLVTGGFIGLCFLIHKHYTDVQEYVSKLDREALSFAGVAVEPGVRPREIDPRQPTAVLLVGSYSGLGIHTLLKVHRSFPGQFKNVIFVSVGVIDSGSFKGRDELTALKNSVEDQLLKYVDLARRLGFAADYRLVLGPEVVSEAEKLCVQIALEFPRCVFFSGQLLFRQDRWYHRLLHNQTAFTIQRRLHWHGATMVVMPIRVLN